MQPNQSSKFTLANIAALTGSIGLGSIILFFFARTMSTSDGTYNALLLLFGGGALLGIIGTITSIVALIRKSSPKLGAVIGLLTGAVSTAILAFIVLLGLVLSAELSGSGL